MTLLPEWPLSVLSKKYYILYITFQKKKQNKTKPYINYMMA